MRFPSQTLRRRLGNKEETGGGDFHSSCVRERMKIENQIESEAPAAVSGVNREASEFVKSPSAAATATSKEGLVKTVSINFFITGIFLGYRIL